MIDKIVRHHVLAWIFLFVERAALCNHTCEKINLQTITYSTSLAKTPNEVMSVMETEFPGVQRLENFPFLTLALSAMWNVKMKDSNFF